MVGQVGVDPTIPVREEDLWCHIWELNPIFMCNFIHINYPLYDQSPAFADSLLTHVLK